MDWKKEKNGEFIMSILLFIILILILALDLIFSKLDIMSPSSLMLFGYLIGLLCFIIANKEWGITFGWSPFILEIVGIFCFVLFDNFFQSFFLTNKGFFISNGRSEYYSNVLVDKKRFIVGLSVLISILQFLITIYTYKELKGLSGSGSLSLIISSYRNNLLDSDSVLRISSFLTFSQKILSAFSFMFLFYFFYYRVIKKIKISSVILLPILFFILQQLLMGGRLQLFRIIIMAVLIYYLLIRVRDMWNINDVRKIVKIGLIVICVGVPLFYSLKFVLGRSSNESLGDYVLRYLGGSTGSFAIYVNNGLQRSVYHGQETFMGIFDFWGRRKGINMLTVLPWANSPTGSVIGNVYGANRRFLADFGMWGLILCNSFMGAFYGFLYGLLKRRMSMSKISPILLTIYSYLVYATFFQFIEGYFYFSIISVNTVTSIILIIFAFYFTKFVSLLRIR